jgi:hypothetical protein
MQTINSLPSLRQHDKELQAELAVLFAKYGLKVTRKAATVYPDSGEIKFRIETSFLTAEGAQAIAEKQWNNYAQVFGLPTDGLGKVVTFNGFAYTITGLDLKARKTPVLITRHGDKKVFKANPEAIARALAFKAPTA